MLYNDCTYVYDKKVEPAPSVGEVFDKAIRHPLQQHFQDKYISENFISIFQNCLDGFPLLYVDILKCLSTSVHTDAQTHTQTKKEN